MKFYLAIALLGVVALWGCDSSTTQAPNEQGELRILLVDRPANYDAVNIVVTEVSAHLADSDSTSGWIVVNNTTRTFDLLTLTNGASQVLGNAPLYPGHYSQIRLKLAESCTIIVDGQTHPHEVPSGAQSGLKLNHPFDIEPNTLYEMTLDFDAMHSIHVTGNGRYILSPVIRVVANQVSGAVSGTINPATSRAIVFALVGVDTVSTFADRTTGAFKLLALPANVYAVYIVSGVPTYLDATLMGVSVIAGHETALGTITLAPR